jgi:hypothetical protein
MTDAAYAPLDAALEILARHGPELRSGLSNHGPMTVEALCALGRPDAVRPWLARYRAELLPAPPARARIGRTGWRAALARPERFADWCVFFERELREDPWPAVLERWAARLAPGLCADATHGVIRVGHAVRSLAAAETPWRLRELAAALASWAAGYQELPVPAPGAPPVEPLPVREAIGRVPLQPAHERRFSGTIVSALEGLQGFPAFAPVIDFADLRGDPERRLAELTDVFARVYLANARDPLTHIVFVHGLTSTAALGSLLPHLGEATARAALRFAWQAGCALYAAFGSQTPQLDGAPGPQVAAADLAERAIAHGDEHAIKFTEACLGRFARDPAAAYLAAADRALRALPRPERPTWEGRAHGAGAAAP